MYLDSSRDFQHSYNRKLNPQYLISPSLDRQSSIRRAINEGLKNQGKAAIIPARGSL